MTNSRIAKLHHTTFEGIRNLDDDRNQFWLARPLAKVLEYSEYRHFLPVAECAGSLPQQRPAGGRPYRGDPRYGRDLLAHATALFC